LTFCRANQHFFEVAACLVHSDDTNTVAKEGHDDIGFSGRKHCKSGNVVLAHDDQLAAFPPNKR
jgi:hypothetical protein